MERIWQKSYDPGVPYSVEYPETCMPQVLEAEREELPPATWPSNFSAQDSHTGNSGTRCFGSRTDSRGSGSRRGTKIAIMLPNTPQCVIAYYAALWLGATVVMTNPLYVEREMLHQWTDSEAQVLFILDHLYPRAEKVLPKTAIRSTIVTSIKDYLPFPLRYLYPVKARFKKLFMSVPTMESVF